MEKKTNFDMIRDIIECHDGYITRKDINELGIPSAVLSQYAKKFNLVKYDTGFYAEDNWPKDELFIFQYEYPKLVYSFYSAAYLHHLIDDTPLIMEVTAPKNYRPFPLPREGVILHTDTKENTYRLGIVSMKTPFSNKVMVYDLEKTICDFIKNKSKIDQKLFATCLSSYQKRNDKNIAHLLKYANEMKIMREVSSLLESIFKVDEQLSR